MITSSDRYFSESNLENKDVLRSKKVFSMESLLQRLLFILPVIFFYLIYLIYFFYTKFIVSNFQENNLSNYNQNIATYLLILLGLIYISVAFYGSVIPLNSLKKRNHIHNERIKIQKELSKLEAMLIDSIEMKGILFLTEESIINNKIKVDNPVLWEKYDDILKYYKTYSK